MVAVKRKIYRKATNLFVGEIFEEMQDDDVLSDLRIKNVYNSSYLNRSLTQAPKIVAFKSFEDVNKDSLVLNTIIEKSPSSKIILIGGSTLSLKKNLRENISVSLPKDANFEAFKTALEEVSFEYNYGEDFNQSDLEFDGLSPLLAKVLWIGLALSLSLMLCFVYFFME